MRFLESSTHVPKTSTRFHAVDSEVGYAKYTSNFLGMPDDFGEQTEDAEAEPI